MISILTNIYSTTNKSLRIEKGDIIGLLTITLSIIFASIIVNPQYDIPIIDDWTYAWSVEHFLKNLELRVLGWSPHYQLFQIIWGALFSYIFGFSFFMLRISTVVLAFFGLLSFFFTLRRLGTDSFYAVLGTLLIFSALFFSFELLLHDR